MARLDASELVQRFGREAEAVCRHYLGAGHRQGSYWQVGDARNTPGRSIYVRLKATAKGPAGKWTDAATGEHGDLLDVIRESCDLIDFADFPRDARRFLSLPHLDPAPAAKSRPTAPAPSGSAEAARRLFAMSQPISGTPVETNLRHRGIAALHGTGNLRFHPRCYYRPDDHGPTETWPAMIAAVTDLRGAITGAHRTWLAPNGSDKAPIDTQRSLECFRDSAADRYLRTTGSPWTQRTGSRVSHRHLTAAMIDSRDFIAARKRAETELLVPAGPKIAFSGGDTADHKRIWAKLDQVHAKHPDMVLMHGGSPRGAEKIASRWAETRRVPQVTFKPDWTKHAKAAPFKRNDAILGVLPIGVLVFPGTGIQDNLADKARKLGIPVYRFASGGA